MVLKMAIELYTLLFRFASTFVKSDMVEGIHKAIDNPTAIRERNNIQICCGKKTNTTTNPAQNKPQSSDVKRRARAPNLSANHPEGNIATITVTFVASIKLLISKSFKAFTPSKSASSNPAQ